MNLKLKVAFLAVTIALASCGKSEKSEPSSSSSIGEKVSGLMGSGEIKKDEYGNAVFLREPLQQFDRYAVVNRTKDLRVSDQEAEEKLVPLYRNLFWAGAKLDYDLLAYDFLKEARTEKDTFKRSDIAKQNKDKLDAAYQEAKKNKYFALYFKGQNEVAIGKYNPEKKGFPINFTIDQKDAFGWRKPNEGKVHPEPIWGVILVGATSGFQDQAFYVPKNEDEARKIESTLSSRRTNGDYAYLPMYYLGHVASAIMKPGYGDFYNGIMVVDGAAIEDPETKQVLFTFDLNNVDKKVVSSSYEIKRAVFPEENK